MSPGASRTHDEKPRRPWIALAFVLATGLRAALVLAFPTIHGGDAAARLANAETAVLAYQLPLPQLFVVLGKALEDDPLLVRLIFCAWGGVLVAGATALLFHVVTPRAALFGALLFSFDPLLTHYSVVPYQEPLAYGLLAWAFYFTASDRGRLGAAFMAAACLCRYEVWLFLPAFVWVSRPRGFALLAGLPILGWILWWQGLAPGGLYVLDVDLQSNRFSRVVYLTGKFLEYETTLVFPFAAAGLVLASRGPSLRVVRSSAVLAIVIGLVVLLGHEYPPGSGLMSERLIHLPVLLALALAAVALDRIATLSPPFFAACLAASLLFAGRQVRFEIGLLRAAAVEPDLALAREVAESIHKHRTKGECVTVIAPPIGAAQLDAYVAKVAAAFGDVDLARRRAAALATASPDRDRIAAHLKAPTATVRPGRGCPLVVLVDSFIAQAPELRGAVIEEISAPPRRAQVLRIPR